MQLLPTQIIPSDTVTFTPGAYVKIVVTSIGDIKVGYSNGTTVTLPVVFTGEFTINEAINQIFATGSTATFTAFQFNWV